MGSDTISRYIVSKLSCTVGHPAGVQELLGSMGNCPFAIGTGPRNVHGHM